MALYRTRKCDEFNLKFLGLILTGAVQFVRKETHSDNVMSYKTSQITGIFYMQIGAHKSANLSPPPKKKTKKTNKTILLIVCHIGRLVLNKYAKKPKKPFLAIKG